MASTASRDQGLARIGSATRWLVAGVLVAGGALSAAAAKSLPGHNGRPAPATASSAGGSASAASSGAASAGAANSNGSAVAAPSASGSAAGSSSVTAPPQAPQPAYNPPVVNSGGS